MAFGMLWDSLGSIWSDIKGAPAMIVKPTPGQTYTPPPTTTPVTKWDDPYNYDWFMARTAADWVKSGDWLTRKLITDYTTGRYTESQYNAIVARATALGSNQSFGDLIKQIGAELGKGATAYGKSVAGDVSTNGVLGGLGGSKVMSIAIVAIGGLVLLRLISR